jgi:hypothetical protein
VGDADLTFLKKRNFIQTDEDMALADDSEMETDAEGINTEFDSDDDGDGITYKDKAALNKMNKDEIITYAKSFGLILTADSIKNDLVASVLNFIEERIAG